MPDITMCNSQDCTARERCYRSPASGTQPSEWRQSWFMEAPGKDQSCNYYFPTPLRRKQPPGPNADGR